MKKEALSVRINEHKGRKPRRIFKHNLFVSWLGSGNEKRATDRQNTKVSTHRGPRIKYKRRHCNQSASRPHLTQTAAEGWEKD